MNIKPSPRIFVSLIILAALLLTSWPATSASAADTPSDLQTETRPGDPPPVDYHQAIQKTTEMVWDTHAQALAAEYGLEILNVTWEDTGRYYNSAVGPNISDMTIQVGYGNPQTDRYELALMPVIRYPNFSDLTADLRLEDFYLLVGNENGEELQSVSLREYLGNFRQYLHDGGSWAGRRFAAAPGEQGVRRRPGSRRTRSGTSACRT